MSDESYSANLTPEEERLGFEVMPVKNPRGEFFLEFGKVQAVVKRISLSDRIIKMPGLAPDTYCYKHQRYGYYGTRNTGRCDWHPVGLLNYPTAAKAVQMIESGRAEALESQMGPSPRVTPVDPGDDF